MLPRAKDGVASLEQLSGEFNVNKVTASASSCIFLLLLQATEHFTESVNKIAREAGTRNSQELPLAQGIPLGRARGSPSTPFSGKLDFTKGS